MFGDPPVFRDDKCVLPLQAADLCAWHARKERELALKVENTGILDGKDCWPVLRVSPVIGPRGALEDVSKNTNLIRDLYALGPWPCGQSLGDQNVSGLESCSVFTLPSADRRLRYIESLTISHIRIRSNCCDFRNRSNGTAFCPELFFALRCCRCGLLCIREPNHNLRQAPTSQVVH
jgi:hypothetical protein